MNQELELQSKNGRNENNNDNAGNNNELSNLSPISGDTFVATKQCVETKS